MSDQIDNFDIEIVHFEYERYKPFGSFDDALDGMTQGIHQLQAGLHLRTTSEKDGVIPESAMDGFHLLERHFQELNPPNVMRPYDVLTHPDNIENPALPVIYNALRAIINARALDEEQKYKGTGAWVTAISSGENPIVPAKNTAWLTAYNEIGHDMERFGLVCRNDHEYLLRRIKAEHPPLLGRLSIPFSMQRSLLQAYRQHRKRVA
ncbi:MAG TPA: hypothetical protein PKD20_05645 [Candidatus Saccharibacteria bacterium]|nr:hypothetical protein [Candidatus Saccharibacteria bacterium]